jgi:hypothetical protein
MYIIDIEPQEPLCPTYKWRIYTSGKEKHTNFKHYDSYKECWRAAIEYCFKYLLK